MSTAISKARRIMIIGQPGSGKSTVARLIGASLNLPVVHIDRIHWQSGWVERTGPEKDVLCAEVHAKDAWVFEGGRSSTWPERLARADALIWLDFPISIRAWRVFWRTIKYMGTERPDLPKGCPERFDWEFTKWIWDTRKTNRLRSQVFFDSVPADKTKYQLRNRAEVAAFMQELKVSA